MDFKECFLQQLNKHRSMMPADAVKLCYQAAFGAEHLLTDIDRARRYFYSELENADAREGELYELISPQVARINLGAWKFRGLPGEWLFNMFLSSAKVNEAGKATLLSYLDVAESCFEGQSLRFDLVGWKAFLDEYKRAEMPALHHSEEYRRYELPSYRIVNSRFVHLLPILDKICKLECRKKAAVIAVDGRAASGKST
jgi:hypothetical protein